MNRAIAAIPVSLSAFSAVLLLAAVLVSAGLLSDDAVRLWAGAITASDGSASLGRIVASYPSVPFLASTVLQFLTPLGTPAPSLLAGAMVGLLAGIWLIELRASGLSFPAAALATLLVALHPALLRSGIASAADMFLAVFLFMFGNALYDLRARATAPEVMAVGFSLLGLGFSHPIGLAFAASPVLIFAAPPSVIANSAINVTLVLLFPTMFCLGAFVYISWVFPGSGWSFFAAPSESLSNWTAGLAAVFGSNMTGWPTLNAGMLAAGAIMLGAPVAIVGLLVVRRRRPLLVPPLVLAGIAVTAAMLTVATGLFGDPAAVGVVAPILAVLTITHVPELTQRPFSLITLLVIGWIGGFVGTIALDPNSALATSSFELTTRAAERADTFRLGRATIGLDGVMVDAEHAPMVVIGRGQARGLVTPSKDAFALSVLTSQIGTPYVAAPDPHNPIATQDEVNKTFPSIFRDGPPGYRLVYQNKSWRLFARNNRDGS